MDNGGYSITEQHPPIDNHQHENSTQIQSNSGNFVNVNNKVKKSPATSTLLYVSFLSSRPSLYIMFSLGNIPIGQQIHLQLLWVHLLCLQV